MDPRNFSFPPPPPPPSADSNYAGAYGQPRYEQSNYQIPSGPSYRASRGGYRGRGRNDGYRGSRRGRDVAYGTAGPNNYYGQTQNYNGYGQTTQASYGNGLPNVSSGYNNPYSMPQTARSPSAPYPPPPPAGPSAYYRPTQQYARPQIQPPPAQRPPSQRTGYNKSYSVPMPYGSAQRPVSRGSPYSNRAHPALSAQNPQFMGPPIRIGFDDPRSRDFQRNAHVPASNNWDGFGHQAKPYNGRSRRQSPGQSYQQNQCQKRGHSTAFGKNQKINQEPMTVLPSLAGIPSLALPKKPPPPIDTSERKPKKKKRKYNTLGLTPKVEEHESSEEDDADEEQKLANTAGTGQQYTITLEGRTVAELKNPAEIIAWVAERKKRFPTQARIKEREEQQQKIREEREQEERVRKTQLKAEKLRKKIQKEERRLAKVEAEARMAKMQAEAAKGNLNTGSPSVVHDLGNDGIRPAVSTTDTDSAAADTIQDESLLQSDTAIDKLNAQENGDVTHSPDMETVVEAKPLTCDASSEDKVVLAVQDGTPSSSQTDMQADAKKDNDLARREDVEFLPNIIAAPSPSSSISSNSDSNSDPDVSSSSPEVAPSKPTGPIKVAPPPRVLKKPQRMCREFSKCGKCRRGKHCKFSHESTNNADSTKGRAPAKRGQKRRKGLYQAMLEREKEEQDRRVVEAIKWLGNKGMLDEANVKDEQKDVKEHAEPEDEEAMEKVAVVVKIGPTD